MKRNVFGSFFIGLGVALILLALLVTGYYLWVQERAGENADQAMDALIQQIGPVKTPQQGGDSEKPGMTDPTVPGTDGEDSYRKMPEVEIDGVAYIGYLEIPALELSLPVISESTEDNLEIAPCRLFGTVYQENFVIGGHRYRRHFRKLSTLGYGERLTFTDVEGNVYVYEVAEIEVVQPYEAEYLCSGGWDLSLFTCTPGGATRVVMRCERVV